jgi:phage virion morphogenesis protein
MTGVLHHVEIDAGLAIAGLERLAEADLTTLADSIGQLMETQTKTRIEDEKTAPDGTPWAPWSSGYAASLKRRNRIYPGSILLAEGDLRDSIANASTGLEAVVGSNLIYAAIHQFGGDTSRGHAPIPARPYLGLSAANRTEVEDLVNTFLEGVLQ